MTLKDPRMEDARDSPEVQVNPGRCVHSLCEQASCRACVDVCPTSAWIIDDDALNLDSARCDGCGLCAAACPQEALSVHMNVLSVELDGKRMILAACDQAVATAGAGVIPCVHSLPVRSLARLVADGIEVLVTSTGDCANCHRGGGERLEPRLSRLNRLFRSRDLAELAHREYPPAAWQTLRTRASQKPDHSLDRRRFLRGGLRQLTRLAQGLSEPDSQAAPQPVSALLGRGGAGLAEWRPQFEETRCEGCNACLRLCPAQALELDEAQHRYNVFPYRCTGCRMCRDVCETDAITLVPWAEATPYLVRLEPRHCRACGVAFALPVAREDGEELCPTCRKANHYRCLFQVLSQ